MIELFKIGFLTITLSDIIDIIISISNYESQSIKIDKERLLRAVKLYFTKPKAPPKE